MQKFEKGFFVGAATAAHQVEGNNIHSDYWVQEQVVRVLFSKAGQYFVLLEIMREFLFLIC